MGELFEYYAKRTPDMRKRVLPTAHAGLAITCDNDADQTQTRHIEVATSETNNG